MGSLFSGPEIKTPKSVTNLTGANNPGAQLEPLNLNAGGLRTNINNNGTVRVSASPLRQRLIREGIGISLNQANQLGDLRARVAPGVSDLRASRLQQLENRRQSSISNLKDNLARRRVLGSSFASDDITRRELEFAQEADRVEAETFLQEIELTNNFINQEAQAKTNAFNTGLNELNLQAQLAQNMSAQASNTLAQSAQLQSQLAIQQASLQSSIALGQAELDAQAQAGAGALIGKVAGVAAAPFTGGTSLALAS